MFKSIFLQTDVTCVQILNNYIAAGVGGFLHIYKLPENYLIQRKKIFDGQMIFGIKPNIKTSKLIVYGGKFISLVNFQVLDLTLDIIITVSQQILSDWILDAKWIENDSKFLTVFMHNKITVWTENIISEVSVKCEERCILYSAHICCDNYSQLLILSGTVFSEVLLWKPSCQNDNGLSPVLRRLKQHKGVIFSIDCNLTDGLICTTSDDRSAVLWKIANAELLDRLDSLNSHLLQINIICQVYGHLSRIFRCLILEDFFITAGEDSLLIMWSFDGKMLRKIDNHQGGTVWALCYDRNADFICSGGNDGAISVIKANQKVCKGTISLPNTECPKLLGLLKSGNIVCLSEKAVLYHQLSLSKKWKEVGCHNDLQKYSLLQISPCKRMVALAGYEGQIYIYSETDGILKLFHTYHLINAKRIFSFHWIDCKTFLVAQKAGLISLYFINEHKINFVQTFILPPAKERWSTCACVINKHIIIGDRKGNIYNFKIGIQDVINFKKKAHNYLGVTNVYSNNDVIISLGRDGFLKRYKLMNGYLEYIDCNKTKFSWLAALESDYQLSFSGDNFVISDSKFQRVLFETHCGGGHRSWDHLKFLENIIFSFIKQKAIHVISLNYNHFKPDDLIEGFHIREINCLKVINVNGNHHLIISGGEDTVLRISVLQKNVRIKILESFKTHLSSIRTININMLSKNDNCCEYLLVTAGGRGQIICWHLQIQIKNLIVSCTEKFNFYEPLDQNNGEMRIMDLSFLKFGGQLFLFAGCSDGFIQVFLVPNNMKLKFQKKLLYSHHSITKLVGIYIESVIMLGSMATDGNLVFWSLEDIYHSDKPKPQYSCSIHQSGITSCSYIVNNSTIMFLSGGDDNCVTLTSFVVSKKENISIRKINSFKNEGIHCAQITGAHLSSNYFVTSSIDQKIVACSWKWIGEQVELNILEKYNTAIADPQGLEVICDDNLSLYVYGNGVEHLTFNILASLNATHTEYP